jgi:two-component system, NtrC family, sensor histidine kinase HydH
MRPYLPNILRISLAFFLILSSGAILYTTAQNYQSAQSLADQALESTGLALSSSAEGALRAGGRNADAEIREIFSDRVVAYGLIADEKGQVLFHTNPRRVGSRLSAEETITQWSSKTAFGRRIILGTGIPAYEFNYLLHRPDGRAELLRLVLHTTPADRIVSQARRMWWVIGGGLILLWTVGGLLERIFTRHLRLQEELEGRERLALIGQMTAVLAHEVRNALGSIKGYAQWVDEKLEPPDPKKAGLAAVLRGTERIESLVQELLIFSRDETFKLERLDPFPLLREAVQSAASSWGGKAELGKEPGILVKADKEKLRRVFLNGVQNALQAMGEEGTLRVSVGRDGKWVQVVMEDTGPGIPEGEIPRLFTPFHTTKTDGTGLGLAYSKKVVEGMGGRISLVNRETGHGAALTVQLPAEKGS